MKKTKTKIPNNVTTVRNAVTNSKSQIRRINLQTGRDMTDNSYIEDCRCKGLGCSMCEDKTIQKLRKYKCAVNGDLGRKYGLSAVCGYITVVGSMCNAPSPKGCGHSISIQDIEDGDSDESI